MRKLTKFFIAVVLLAAYSCATDTTEDLGVKHGQGLTEITVSIEESRMQLGAENNGLYPLYWSEGDQISVNGLPSNVLTKEEAGKASATFFVGSEDIQAYHIAYPAAAENQVLFAENQVHLNNTTFGSGVSTMYGKGAVGEAIQMHHLTGVLKIGVTGSALLTHAQISTIDRAPIAGAFAFDFEKEELSATDASKDVINYSFGEGVTLSSEPTYLHVAVPAGEYDELYVTLYDKAGGVMYATVQAGKDNKPLSAGKVRTFDKNIAYEAKNNVKYFVISNVATLKEFATKAAEGLAMDALLVADIDLAGEAWTSIEGEGFVGTVLGNGYSIKGLNAPLFNTTSASFKGLHLEGVAINESANPNVGALARAIVATDTVKPTVEHCSANGTITVNCTEYALASGATGTMAPFAIGGLVGRVEGADLDHCTSGVALDVDQVIATSNATKIYIPVGGVVGLVSNHNTVLSNLSDLENTAAVDVHEVSCTTVSYGNSPVLPYVGGVVGYTAIDNHNCTITNLTNRGSVSVGGQFGIGAGATADIDYTDVDLSVAGVVGYLDTANGSGLKNYGDLTFDFGQMWFLYIGGVAGQLGKDSVLTKSENHGKITLPYAGEHLPKIPFLHCAGVVAHTWEGSALSECDNYGGIAIAAGLTVGGASGHRYFRVGGVAGFTRGSVTNCHNKKGANIDISGSIGGAPNWQDDAIGGVVAVAYNHPVKDCSNSGAIKSGANNNSTSNGRLGHTIVGGVVGIASKYCDNVTNNGTIIFLGNTKILYLGGCVGFLGNSTNTGKVGGYTNNGRFEFRGATSEITTSACQITTKAWIGGCIGNAEGDVYNATNNGKMELCGVKHSGENRVGGVVGYITSKATDGIHSSTNTGDLIIDNTTLTGNNYIAGVTAVVSGKGSNLTNEGDLTLSFTRTATGNARAFISGVGGYIAGESSNFVNKGTITVNGSLEQTRIGGIAANGDAASAANCTFTGFKNEGDIIFNADVVFNSNNHACIGGLWGDCNTAHTLVDCYNKGNITISKDASAAYGSNTDQAMYVGGLFGYNRGGSAPKTFTRCYNTGNVTVEEGATIVNLYTGGCFGKFDAAPVINENGLRTIGNVKVLNGASESDVNRVGGVVGWNAGTLFGAQVVCEVVAPGVDGVGMVTGMAHSTSALASSCKLGGKIAVELDTNGEPIYKEVSANRMTITTGNVDEGEGETVDDPRYVPFWRVIYGNAWEAASKDNCDNCSYLGAITIE